MEILSNSLIVKSNHVIEASYNLPLNGHRLLAAAISSINKNSTSFGVIKLHVREIARVFGIDKSKAIYENIEAVVDDLMSEHITIRSGNEWLKYQWVTKSYYKNGFVYLKFNDELLPYLTSLISFFTSYELKNIVGFTTSYQFRIYDLCKQYEKIGERIISVNDLRVYLCLSEEKYRLVGHLKDRIIIPSINEISKKSDIYVYLEKDIKEGRRTVALRFIIKKNDNKIELNCDNGGNAILGNIADGETSNMVNILLGAGIAKTTAEELAKSFDQDQIQSAIEYTEAQKRAGTVKNPVGFLINAIKNNYKDNRIEEQKKKEKDKKAKIEQEAEIKSAQKKAYELRSKAIDEFINSLSETQMAELQAEFIEGNKSNQALMKSFHKNGIKSPMVMGCFRDFIFKIKIS